MKDSDQTKEKQQVEAWLKKASPRQLIDAIHERYGAYVFFGIPGEQMQKDEDLLPQSFQTCFKSPTIAEALGMADFFKHSLMQSQMNSAQTSTDVRDVTEGAT